MEGDDGWWRTKEFFWGVVIVVVFALILLATNYAPKTDAPKSKTFERIHFSIF
jgi:hypothetical protein